MRYNFDTDNEDAAVGALLVYVVYRSRDPRRFRPSLDMWSMIERAVKSVAKRAEDLGEFIERLKPKLHCPTIQPRWANTAPDGLLSMKLMPDGTLVHVPDDGRRHFLTDVLQSVDHRTVLDLLYRQAALIVLLVRDRLERERPLEGKFLETNEGDNSYDA